MPGKWLFHILLSLFKLIKIAGMRYLTKLSAKGHVRTLVSILPFPCLISFCYSG
jgi:hypothetical protein